MRLSPPFILAGIVVILLVDTSWSAPKIIVLKSGDTLTGEVIDRTEDEVSIQLKTGVLIRLATSEIHSIEEPVTKPEPTKESPVPSKNTDNLNLRSIFEKPNPTPTPLPLVPLDLRLNYTRRQSKDPSTLTLLPPILPSEATIEDSSSTARQIKGTAEEFGEVIWTQGLTKFRHHKETWQPALVGTKLLEGDELGTLSGSIEIHSRDGAIIRLHPSTEARFGKRGVAIDRGKGWLEWRGKDQYSVFAGGVEAQVENAVVRMEHLKSGLKFVLLEGNGTLYKRPEGEIIRGELKGPVTLLLNESRDVISRGDVEEAVRDEWAKWEAARAGTQSPATGLVSESTPAADMTQEERSRLLQQEALQTLKTAIETFYLDVGQFPKEQRPFFRDLVTNPGSPDWNGPYLKDVELPLVDQWGSELLYRLRTDPVSGEISAEVFSLGPNKTFEQGEGDDLGVLVTRPGH